MELPVLLSTSTLTTQDDLDHHMTMNSSVDPLDQMIHITLRVRPRFFLFAEVSAILCVIFGVFGNVLTVVTISLTKRIRDNSNNIFVCNMAISDSLFCGIVLPFTALKYSVKDWPLPLELCAWLAFLKFLFTCMSLMSLCMIAFNRYIYLIHTRLQVKIFKMRNICIFLFTGWLVSVFLTILPIIHVWGEYTFDPDVVACTFSRNSSSYRKFIVSLSLFVPILFMSICYSRICLRVYKVRRQLNRWTPGRNSKKMSQSNVARRENLQLTTTMILIFLLHVVSCLPYTCVSILDPDVQYPVFHIVTPPIAWLQFVLNPVVYTIANLQFRKAYKLILLKAMCQRSKLFKLKEASIVRNENLTNGVNSTDPKANSAAPKANSAAPKAKSTTPRSIKYTKPKTNEVSCMEREGVTRNVGKSTTSHPSTDPENHVKFQIKNTEVKNNNHTDV